MKVKVFPSHVHGSVSIPSSKSMAHRAIICAALSKGKSEVSNIHYSKDIEATLSCMEALGAKIEKKDHSCTIIGTSIENQTGDRTLNCNESGSTLRFLVPLASLVQGKVTFKGQGRLMSRPMDIYESIFENQNLFYEQKENIQVQGSLMPGIYKMPGNVSSQFISGLLFLLPLLKKDSTIEILEPYESKSYVDLTISMLKKFQIQITQTSSNTYHIPGNQEYVSNDIVVEGDYSQMAFFAVLSYLNGSIDCLNMDINSLQGDKAILSILEQYKTNQDVCIDLSNCPDLGPILCVLASFYPHQTKIIHAQRLRVKESDRIEAMETELKKWGVNIESTFDTITVFGKDNYCCPEVVELYGHNDHRIVMALTVFGLCAKSECIIDDAQAISKSYPHFFEDIQKIHGKVLCYDF
ncbi:3-phosphoshikimate 1-carboxyvinyltransferase [Floccifex sp.]|uniref:3-phosphoshikimate 1-carboxyvinyltransferase n=1 Tax=Floccifex sp. TaxID=2815810 RepID=UPI003F095112